MSKNGLLFALFAAFISGLSVFVNGIGVNLADPILFSAIKNSAALLLITSSILIFKEFNQFKTLSNKQLLTLILIGIIGGSVPFILFFSGLKMGGAIISSFIFRSLFIFCGIFGYFILKETPSTNELLGALLIFCANAFLISGELVFGLPQTLVLLATIFWALEYTISRKILAELNPRIIIFFRMFFGSIILFAFSFFNGPIQSIPTEAFPWIVLTSILLFGFLSTWYLALKHLTVFSATSILTIGGLVSAFLNFAFLNKIPTQIELLSLFFLLVGVIFVSGIYGFRKELIN